MHSIKQTYRIFAIGMATLMLLTACVFTVDIHYCQGHFKSFSVLGKARACYEIAACPMHQNEEDSHEKEDKNCCHNESFQFQAEHDLAFEYEEVVSLNILSTLPEQSIIKPQLPLIQTQDNAYILYRPPPLLLHHHPAFLQSFLL